MSAARLVSASLAFGAALLYGAVSKQRQRAELTQLSEIRRGIEELAVCIELGRRPLAEALDAITANDSPDGILRAIAQRIGLGSSPAEAFAAVSEKLRNDEVRTVLGELFSKLGSADANTEIRRLNEASARLRSIDAQAAENAEKRIKLTGSLSVMLGLAAALLLL